MVEMANSLTATLARLKQQPDFRDTWLRFRMLAVSEGLSAFDLLQVLIASYVEAQNGKKTPMGP
jgi:hypothetical protein